MTYLEEHEKRVKERINRSHQLAFVALAKAIGLYDDKPTLQDDAETDFILSHQS